MRIMKKGVNLKDVLIGGFLYALWLGTIILVSQLGAISNEEAVGLYWTVVILILQNMILVASVWKL